MIFQQEKNTFMNRINIMYKLLLGLNHLHSSGIIHRALTPETILLENQNIKITKFSLIKNFTTQKNNSIVKIGSNNISYAAPEVILKGNYSVYSDMWSLGCIFVELFNNSQLFTENNGSKK